MPIDFRKPWWIVFIVICVAGGIYSWFYFAEAFPILDLELTMDREASLQQAKSKADEFGLGPDKYSQAAKFSYDGEVQAFVELEAGGKDAYREMIREGHYHPYQWTVRHFKENKTRETEIRFTPTGELYGFTERWPEDDTGPALAPEEARAIAERQASEHWGVSLNQYELVSSGQEEQPSGRVDHRFVYERTDISIGEGDYRLELGVSGDQLSEVEHFVRVPEAFSRRYKNMRSANQLIQTTGTGVMYVVYLLGGCILGSFWLIRNNALKWRKPLAWGGLITGLLFLLRLNSLPLAWMNYDTALTTGGFLSQQIVGALTSSLTFGLIITISFIAAEGLTRMAFGHHPKLWKTWSPKAAGTKTITSLTGLGYLMLGIYFAYNVGLYSFAFEWLGWWSPSSLLYNPDVLAHYFPWLSPVVNSLRAGFWEECLFRAVPLAGAALLGDYFGRKRWWIGSALVIQALVFGAGHAAYATQPSYARVIELFASSIGLGIVYLAFGLLPVVIAHYLYDLILMGLPIFVSTAEGIWVSQLMIVLLGLVPLVVVLFGWWYNGSLYELPEELFNRFRSTDQEVSGSEKALPVREGLGWNRVGVILVVGLVGMGLWIQGKSFESVEIPLDISRGEAHEQADELMSETGRQPGDWMVASHVHSGQSDDDRFVWQSGGDTVYGQLMGSYLDGPRWHVRFMKFKGSVASRAEEFNAYIAPGYGLKKLTHQFPEAAPGESLGEAKAREIADSVVQNRYGQDPGELNRISAEPTARPNRRDWSFVYGVPKDYPLEEGGARISVSLAGSEVTDVSRYVFIPESWERNQRSRSQIIGQVHSAGRTLLYLFLFAGAGAGIVCWGKGKPFSRKAFLVVTGVMFGLPLVQRLNGWHGILVNLSTAEPFYSQLAQHGLGLLMQAFPAVLMGLVAGYCHGQIGETREGSLGRSALSGVGISAIGLGLLVVAGMVGTELEPVWGQYESLGKVLPWFHHSIASLSTLVNVSLVLLLFAVAQHHLTRAGSRYRWYTVGGMVLYGMVLASMNPGNTLVEWGLYSLVIGGLLLIVSLFVLPYDRSLVPGVAVGLVVLNLVETMLTSGHPYALVGPILAIVVVVAVGVFWIQKLQHRQLSVK